MDGRHQPQLPVLNMSSALSDSIKRAQSPLFSHPDRSKAIFSEKFWCLHIACLSPKAANPLRFACQATGAGNKLALISPASHVKTQSIASIYMPVRMQFERS